MKSALARNIFNAALAAADPYHAVAAALRTGDGRFEIAGRAYDPAAFNRIIVVGAGKATARMAEAVEAAIGSFITSGIIAVKYGHAGRLSRVEQIEAGHPVPDESGVRGTRRILDLVRGADGETLIICLLSGGGSSLLVAPLPGITLDDKQKTTELLLKAGASIGELNAVRKHLSAVKGGRLAQAAFPATVITLILSDVIGDRLDVIASGPTAPDSSTFEDAGLVLAKYGVSSMVPPRAAALIGRGASGREPETAKSGDSCFRKIQNTIIGSNTRALEAAKRKAEEHGYAAEIHATDLQGDAADAAHTLASLTLKTLDSMRPGERRALLSGGETTVTVRGTGKGGRNQEMALVYALEVAGREGITLLSAGTDGTDGPTIAAGAVVDGNTASRARARGLRPEAFLENNDSYTFFQQMDADGDPKLHIITGPTGTNVMDIQIILLDR